MKSLKIAVAGVLTCLAVAASAEMPTDPEDGDYLAEAFDAISARDWVAADHAADQISHPVGSVLVTWSRLRAGEGAWEEYRDFLADHGDWPGLKRLRRQGEAAIPADLPPAEVRAYFADQLPQTGSGALKLARAYAAQGRTSEARTEAIRAWRTLTMRQHEADALLDAFDGALSRHHVERLDALLWDGRTKSAEAMLPLVPAAQQKLAKARLALQRGTRGVDAIIEAVPEALRDDPGLAYDRFNWRLKRDRWDEAQEILVLQSGSVETLGQPEKWASSRRTFARRAMRADQNDLAYWLASEHGLKEGANFADLEWLSGYIALTKLDAPEQALAHFKAMQAAVRTPVSLGRAGYWLGRAYDALGQTEEAKAGYETGARYQTSFYGQLAAEQLGVASDPALSGTEIALDWRDGAFAEMGPAQAAGLLDLAQQQNMMRWFLTHLAETLPATEIEAMADMALELDRPYVALGVAKEAAKRGIVIPRSYFPVTELATYSAEIAPEIAMSIARRESELNPEAVSHAGARGLMQIMPRTARQVAGELGVDYSRNRLTTDWRYNARLGTAYLGGLLEIYDGSYVLAFAAYNAGPHRADAWIERFGDPRDSLVDQIDWIEHIPFRETRNYVMRVMESLHVYRARLGGAVTELQITDDLSRG